VFNDDYGALWVNMTGSPGWVLGWGTGNRAWACSWATIGTRYNIEMQFGEATGSAEFNVYTSYQGGGGPWTYLAQTQLYPRL
jgi:hypothetical protein